MWSRCRVPSLTEAGRKEGREGEREGGVKGGRMDGAWEGKDCSIKREREGMGNHLVFYFVVLKTYRISKGE